MRVRPLQGALIIVRGIIAGCRSEFAVSECPVLTHVNQRAYFALTIALTRERESAVLYPTQARRIQPIKNDHPPRGKQYLHQIQWRREFLQLAMREW